MKTYHLKLKNESFLRIYRITEQWPGPHKIDADNADEAVEKYLLSLVALAQQALNSPRYGPEVRRAEKEAHSKSSLPLAISPSPEDIRCTPWLSKR